MSIENVEGGSWWALSESVKDGLKELLVGRHEFTLHPYKRADGTWAFDLPELLTWGEGLVGGTDTNLDYWWAKLKGDAPVVGSKFEMVVSSSPIDELTTVLKFVEVDVTSAESSWYYDAASKIHCWLCPYLRFLFGEAPEKIYVHLAPI